MKRPSEDERGPSQPRSNGGVEQFLNNLAARHAGKLKWVGLVILVMCLVAIVLAVAGR